MSRSLLSVALWALACSACLDNVGPRPRPGGESNGPPPSNDSTPVLRYYELQPRVITPGLTDSVRITVTLSGTPEIVDLDTRAGFLVGFTQVSAGVWTAKIAPSILLFAYHTGDLHNAVGYIELYRNGETTEYPVIVNVRDATVPLVNAQPVATTMQAMPHVVNIRYDSIFAGGAVPAAVLKSFYAQFPDNYQFAAVVEQVESHADASFTLVRNSVNGIGLQRIDNGGRYGSATSLEGILNYPYSAAFDPADATTMRLLAHRWINYLQGVQPVSAHPNWPLSDQAYGMAGWRDPETGAPLTFPFQVVPQANGTFTLKQTEPARSFNDLELYLMGLLPADSVNPHIVFRNQNQKQNVLHNGVLTGPVDTVTVAKLSAVDGARTPSVANAPHDFAFATIVLSSGRLLNREELSFFEYMATRGEQRTALPFFTGAIHGTTFPFYPATVGHGTLSTRINR